MTPPSLPKKAGKAAGCIFCARGRCQLSWSPAGCNGTTGRLRCPFWRK